ncbi:cysteine desulfurase family protein [Belliella aquatica]|uniref:cysteine desulfurase n=1 Tax=Belliella aquatica TaxID=1323734 RepID=A0ABQ1MW43_9BACT|nr:cysteine desulfurase family protein [Belliella aquatica]MCH7406648.1 cysteine desulfurase [Belliella aquatica]GGC47756.1 cysteine desulfurase IscS [Belliella aquatica]
MNYPIYLDYNATTPCAPEVVEAMLPYFTEHFGNAASKSHPFGWMAENAVEMARENVASLIGANPKEIIFTSGATEAINIAIKGTFERYGKEKQHYISCQTEHKAVLDTLKKIEEKGAEITLLPVNSHGQIDPLELESSIRPETKMICLMWANNETGVIYPVEKIAQIAAKHDIIFFTDAVQAVGKIPIDVNGIHLMALSAHKFYGPKGVGVLYIRHNHELPKPISQIDGGGHEKGFRSGTINVPGIVGLGKAAEIAKSSLNKESKRLKSLRDKLEIGILEIEGTILNAGQSQRLDHVSNISFQGIEGENLLREINREVAVSSGSACTSISPKPSHVLAAMGIEADLGRASVRFSLGRMITEEEIDKVIRIVRNVVEKLRD